METLKHIFELLTVLANLAVVKNSTILLKSPTFQDVLFFHVFSEMQVQHESF